MMQEWPSVLIETTIHVVQQQLHLRHAIRGACTIRVGLFDSDSKIGKKVLSLSKNPTRIVEAPLMACLRCKVAQCVD